MQMATESLRDDIMQRIQEQNRREEEAEFNAWHADLVALPSDFKRKLENGWKADIELQPLRWMDRRLTLIQSAKVTGYVQLANGVQGPPIGSFLPYPVFQSGAEIFLKGMWLCRHEDCRLLGFSSFMEPDNRKKYLDELKNSLGHNLIKIIKAIRTIRSTKLTQDLLSSLPSSRQLSVAITFRFLRLTPEAANGPPLMPKTILQ